MDLGGGQHISGGHSDSSSAFARNIAPQRLPTWVLAEHAKPVRKAALRALGGRAQRVTWTVEAAAWLGAPDPIKLVVCEDLAAPGLLATLHQAMVRTSSKVIVLTTDAPERIRLLLRAGVFDVIRMPAAPKDVAASLDRATSSMFSATLFEAVEALGHEGVLQSALRLLATCVEVRGPRPPHSMAALAREARCSATYLQDSARQCGLDLAAVASCVVLLRAINERRWLPAPWSEIGERVGYRDETGLAKLARRTLEVGLGALEEREAELRERLTSLVGAR